MPSIYSCWRSWSSDAGSPGFTPSARTAVTLSCLLARRSSFAVRGFQCSADRPGFCTTAFHYRRFRSCTSGARSQSDPATGAKAAPPSEWMPLALNSEAGSSSVTAESSESCSPSCCIRLTANPGTRWSTGSVPKGWQLKNPLTRFPYSPGS